MKAHWHRAQAFAVGLLGRLLGGMHDLLLEYHPDMTLADIHPLAVRFHGAVWSRAFPSSIFLPSPSFPSDHQSAILMDPHVLVRLRCIAYLRVTRDTSGSYGVMRTQGWHAGIDTL